jgi:hypothetical protein
VVRAISLAECPSAISPMMVCSIGVKNGCTGVIIAKTARSRNGSQRLNVIGDGRHCPPHNLCGDTLFQVCHCSDLMATFRTADRRIVFHPTDDREAVVAAQSTVQLDAHRHVPHEGGPTGYPTVEPPTEQTRTHIIAECSKRVTNSPEKWLARRPNHFAIGDECQRAGDTVTVVCSFSTMHT